MADVTASMVKDLRERTGAGMMDCKNALVEAGGDLAVASEIIQKKGLAKAVKAAGRVAAEGMVVAKVDPESHKGILVEVNCQTDFVARGDEFKNFAKLVGHHALVSGVTEAEALQALGVDGKTLREHAEALTAKSGEKHAIRRITRFETSPSKGVITAYIHHGDRLGAMVELSGEKGNTPELREFADELALQLASMGAKFIRKEDAPADVIAKQREIFVGQLKNEDDTVIADYDEAMKSYEEFKLRTDEDALASADKVKEHLKGLEKKSAAVKARPEVAKQKIVDGKLNKWLSEMTLLEQLSVKDSDKKIAQLVTEMSAKIGKVEIVRIARFDLGEGIDKGPTKDFATEVAEMAAGAQKK